VTLGVSDARAVWRWGNQWTRACADDMGPQLGSYGEPLVHTPHLDQLAREGVRYTHAFTTSPICSSRPNPGPTPGGAGNGKSCAGRACSRRAPSTAGSCSVTCPSSTRRCCSPSGAPYSWSDPRVLHLGDARQVDVRVTVRVTVRDSAGRAVDTRRYDAVALPAGRTAVPLAPFRPAVPAPGTYAFEYQLFARRRGATP